jgi:hypothetical protein
MVRTCFAVLAGLLVCVLSACSNEDTLSLFSISPTQGLMSGYYVVTLTINRPDDFAEITLEEVTEVFVGHVKAIELERLTSNTLRFVTQGHPVSGTVDVTLHDEAGTEVVLKDAFEFSPNRVLELSSMGAMGASLTQGIQRGVPTDFSVRNGPAARLAQQLGIYFPLPLLIPNAFREMTVEDMGPAPYCDPPALDVFQQEQAVGLIESMTTETGRFDYALGRLTPSVQTHNFAVGGTRVRELLEGPPPADLALNFLAHLVYEPSGTITDPVMQSQMDAIEALDPKLIVCFDCLGNDLIEGMINAAPFDLSARTSDVDLAYNVEDLVARLAQLNAHVFLANLPKPNVLPFFQTKQLRLVETGVQTDAPAYLAELEQASVLANEALQRAARAHDMIHVVDIAALADVWLTDRVSVSNESLAIEPFGGLVGLDGLHFTDVGYGLLANAFITQINEVFGAAVPLLDVAVIRGSDRERVQLLIEQGLDVDACR